MRLHTGEMLSLSGVRRYPLRLVWQEEAVDVREVGLTQATLFGDQS